MYDWYDWIPFARSTHSVPLEPLALESGRPGRLLAGGNRRRLVRASCACLFTAFALVACGAQQRPDGGQGVLPVGAVAPDVSGHDVTGQESRLSQNRGRLAVVYFYPKDATPGCTREACSFRDTWARFSERGVQIFGVSRDNEASHTKFLKEHELPFPLVADDSGRIQKAYGVPDRLGMAARVTFLIDKSGRIARVWPDVDPGVHADEVLHAVDELARIQPQ
ncbi:MAG: hypothetical protein RL701_8152 [Pseudomonadota bacterium]